MKVLKELNNKSLQDEILNVIGTSLSEVRKVLSNVPANIDIYFDDFCLMKEYGVGGFAYSKNIITIAVDETYEDREKQFEYLRQTVFHEAYHLSQGFWSEGNSYPPIQEAIYEGAATVFERNLTGSPVPYGQYDLETVAKYVEIIKNLNIDYDFERWKFYDKESQQKWILYKVGTYLIDSVIIKTGKSIIDLNKLSAIEILNLI